MNLYGKPLIILGYGVRAAGADPTPLLDLGVPIISTWQGADLVDSRHPNYFGRAGIYGQRCANKVMYEAETIIAIGVRFSPYFVGHAGLRPEQKVTMVDIDRREAAKMNYPCIEQDAKEFIDSFKPNVSCYTWLKLCQRWKEQWDWVEYPAHEDTNGFINTYQFVRRIEPFLAEDEIIITDDGGNMCPVFQTLRVKPPQRIITTGALGEMGCAIPGAIGASIARKHYVGREPTYGKVTCFIGDGGFMLNVQELATIRYRWLPIRMFVFENDGYSMIKGTYDNLKKERAGVSRETGLGLADPFKIAQGFDIPRCEIKSWDNFKMAEEVMKAETPFVCVVRADPEQQFLPRLKPIIENGKITPARFDQLSPLLD